jgi:hypothetical protein
MHTIFMAFHHPHTKMEQSESFDLVQTEVDCSESYSDYCDSYDDEFDALTSVALNNIGVSLLVRGAYRLSLDTFADSIAILQDVYRADHQPSTTVRRMLDSANKRLALTFNPAWKPTTTTHCVKPITHAGDVFHGLNFIIDPSDECPAYYPAWIDYRTPDVAVDDEGLRVTTEIFDSDFHSALIFYNYALAHLCLAQDLSGSGESPMDTDFFDIECSERLQKRALRILDMVHEILDSISRSTAWSLMSEDSRLTLAALSQTHSVFMTRKFSNLLVAKGASNRLSSTIDAWQRWSGVTADLFDDSTTVRLVDDIGHEASLTRLDLRHQIKRAPAA